jgi:hypothetical protein
LGGFSLPKGWAGLCSPGWLGDSSMVCGGHLFVLSIDAKAGLELLAAAARKNDS